MTDEYCGVKGLEKFIAESNIQYDCSLSPNEEFHCGYGCTLTRISKADLDRLIAGEPIWFDDGEYSHIIILES
jgi:hypothetical protein